MKRISHSEKFTLSHKNVVVTGGAGILGKRFCFGYGEAGANVAIVDIDYEKVRELAYELSNLYGIKAIGIKCDVSSPGEVNSMVKVVVEELGSINVLHNNAASKSANLEAFFETFEDYSLDEWRKVMSVNIDGMFLVAQAVGREMVRRKNGGSIIQMASIYGVVAPDQRIYEGSHYLGRQINTPAVYAASKGAVISLTKYLAAYWGHRGIRVNTISPGGVESGQNDIFKVNYSNRVPLGRMAKGDELVGVAIFLASEASSYITGQNLVVDGGLSTW